MRVGLAAALILSVVALSYGPALPYPFVLDDHSAIERNPTLVSLLGALSPPEDTAVSGRPVVNLSFALDHAWSGRRPAGYRLVNLALHALNGVLVFGLLAWCFAPEPNPAGLRTRASWLALATALLWVCHPLQSEAVVYVTQRTELLSSLCLLLCVHAALRAMRNPGERTFSLLAIAACAIGAGCKETSIVAPVLVLLFDRAFFSASLRAALRARPFLYAGLLLAELPLLIQLLTRPRGDTAGFGLGVSALESLAVQGGAVARYLGLAFWPARLSVVYNWPVRDAIARYLVQDLAVAALGCAALALFRARPRLGLPALGFFVLLAPSSSIVPVISEVVAERRMYLPLVCVLALIAVIVQAASDRYALSRHASSWVIAIACVACGFRTAARVSDYRSPIALFRSALAVAPDNPMAMWGLGDALEAAGRFREALRYYERMGERHYPYLGPSAWGTRGLMAASQLYARSGDERNAELAMQRALLYDPESAVGRLNRAAALARSGQRAAAISGLEAMLREQPFLHARAHRELAALMAQLGRRSQALAHVREAARLDPNDDATRRLLANLSAMR